MGIGKLAVIGLSVLVAAAGMGSLVGNLFAGSDRAAAFDSVELRKDDVAADETVDDADDRGDGDRTIGNDGTRGGDNTGDGDRTAGNDGTDGGDNTYTHRAPAGGGGGGGGDDTGGGGGGGGTDDGGT